MTESETLRVLLAMAAEGLVMVRPAGRAEEWAVVVGVRTARLEQYMVAHNGTREECLEWLRKQYESIFAQ